MPWRVAPCLNVLLDDVNVACPGRDKSSDGSIGNAAHAARGSDHNPDSRGIVHARDITNDPPRCKIHEIVRRPEVLRDVRTKYIISQRKIMAFYAIGGYAAYAERPYHGTNAHDHHAHISAKSGVVYENDTRRWLSKKGGEIVSDPDVKKIQEEIELLRHALGDDYGASISKALFVVRRDANGKAIKGKDGKVLHDEHLNVIDSKLDEIYNTLGEFATGFKALTDAVKALTEKANG